jgi:hypothetical protein
MHTYALRLSLLASLLSVASPSLASPAGAVRLARRNYAHTTTVTAHPAEPTEYYWARGAVTEFPLHESCNSTQRAVLRRAFSDGIRLAQHAKEHILRWGNSSAFYQRYFGAAPTAEPIGWYERIVSADRRGLLFRCDDIDGNCRLNPSKCIPMCPVARPSLLLFRLTLTTKLTSRFNIVAWGGHWRGANATNETVICPPSYTSRYWLEMLCGYGYRVGAGNPNAYFAGDMLHRWMHLPGMSEGVVDHYTPEGADEFAASLELARTRPHEAVRNTGSLQYFALDVYAFDIAVPGVGCPALPLNASSLSASAAPPTTKTPATHATTTAHASAIHTDAASHSAAATSLPAASSSPSPSPPPATSAAAQPATTTSNAESHAASGGTRTGSASGVSLPCCLSVSAPTLYTILDACYGYTLPILAYISIYLPHVPSSRFCLCSLIQCTL